MLLIPQTDKANGIPCILLAGSSPLPQSLITKHTLNTHEVPHLPQAPCQQSQHRGMMAGGHEVTFFLICGTKFLYAIDYLFFSCPYPTTNRYTLSFLYFRCHVFHLL